MYIIANVPSKNDHINNITFICNSFVINIIIKRRDAFRLMSDVEVQTLTSIDGDLG